MHAHDAVAAIRRPNQSHGATRAFVARELMLWASIYPLYLAVRGWSITDPEHAFADAWRVIGWEHATGLFHDRAELVERLKYSVHGNPPGLVVVTSVPGVTSVTVLCRRCVAGRLSAR